MGEPDVRWVEMVFSRLFRRLYLPVRFELGVGDWGEITNLGLDTEGEVG